MATATFSALQTVRNLPLHFKRLLAVYGAVAALLWTVPLLSILHAESSAIIAAVAFFGAGISTRSMLREGRSLPKTFLLQEAALLIPLALLTVSLLWRPNCGYAQGLMFYTLFPAITVPFAVALMVLLHALGTRRPVFLFSVVGILLMIVPPVYDVGFHPQFYTYNHVFGGILGPIYEDDLAIRPGLFFFRSLTLLWSAFFVAVAGIVTRKVGVYPVALLAALIGGGYAFSAELGMVTTPAVLQRELGAVRHTAHFSIYYDPEVVTEAEIEFISDDHEFRYDQLQQQLHVSLDSRIQSYIYPDGATKARLTGARRTNVAPVWLQEPQVHVLYGAYDRVFAHELVHVFSREFGLPLLNASVSVGLVEGLAVAFEPPDGSPSPLEQVSAAVLSGGTAMEALTRAGDLSRAIAARLSPLGFWSDRGAVSYTAMGSFVRFLIAAYGVERFKRVYGWADFDAVYGRSAEELAAEWSAHILALEAVSASAHDVVTARFAIPSLFEQECPHYVPPHRRALEAARTALVRKDTSRAEALADKALQAQPKYLRALELWSELRMRRGDPRSVIDRVDELELDTLTAPLFVRLGDAHAASGDADEARTLYDAALSRLPVHAHESRSLVLLRRARTTAHARSGDASQALRALRHAQEERYEQAFGLLRTTSPSDLRDSVPVRGDELVRRRFVWLARLAYRNGSLAEAAGYADSAAVAYTAVGAFNEAAVHHDFRRRVQWAASRQMERVAGGEYAAR